ncbi:MAG: alpha/beta hydrolase-fold protein [candidate division WOR-3 bacterium]
MRRLFVLFLFFSACAPRQAGRESGFDPLSVMPEDVLLPNPDSVLREAQDAYNRKDYPRAASAYLDYVSRNNQNAIALYNLACCFGLMGDSIRASAFLRAAWDAGYWDTLHILRDPDFEPVRGSLAFKSTMDGIMAEATRGTEGKNKVYLSVGTLLPCYVVVPEDYDAEERYPLVIGLHGYGSDPKQFSDLFRRPYKTDTTKKSMKISFIYAVPCAPYPVSLGGKPGYSWTPPEGEIGKRAIWMDADYITSLPRELLKSYNIDTTRVYLLGFSQGASMAYTIGLNNYKRFKGIIAFAGWFDTTMVSLESIRKAKAEGMKVFIAHGKYDQSVPVTASMGAYKFLKEIYLDVWISQFEGGHEVPMETLEFAIKWMGL